MAIESFREIADFCKALLATGELRPRRAASGRVLLHPGGPMLPFVPVVFDAYRLLKPRMWPVMQALVAHADRAGRCWPSVRRIAEITGVPKSTAARYLLALERAGHLSRTWRKGGRCVYQIAARFLPGQLSHRRGTTVPPPRREESPIKKTSDSALPDDADKWGPRLRSWHRSRFWLPFWGPKPTEPGCFAPAALLQQGMQ